MTDTLVAGNGSGDCNAVAGSADQGHNLDSDGSCFGTGGSPEATGDLVKRNPKLGPLTDNGGPLATLALLPGSPAIGAGACGIAGVSTDARGVKLPASHCDIGAFQTADSNLALRLSHGRPRLGHALTLHFRITNAGPGPALTTSFLAKLPAHLRLVDVRASSGRCSGHHGRVTCAIGAIDSSATGGSTSATVTLVVTPTRKGRSTLRASVTSSSKDPSQGNNHATLHLKVR